DEYLGSRAPDIVHLRKRRFRERILDRAASFRALLKSLHPRQKSKEEVARTINAQACMFFVHRGGLQSSVVVSNVNNPETNINPNSGAVLFRIQIYNSSGILAEETKPLIVKPNETKELFISDIFDNPPSDFLGSVYVQYYDLVATNTLRPYCVLNYF